jgi:hypothetical protein
LNDFFADYESGKFEEELEFAFGVVGKILMSRI